MATTPFTRLVLLLAPVTCVTIHDSKNGVLYKKTNHISKTHFAMAVSASFSNLPSHLACAAKCGFSAQEKGGCNSYIFQGGTKLGLDHNLVPEVAPADWQTWHFWRTLLQGRRLRRWGSLEGAVGVPPDNSPGSSVLVRVQWSPVNGQCTVGQWGSLLKKQHGVKWDQFQIYHTFSISLS